MSNYILPIIRTPKHSNFAQIANEPLNDERLSFSARGVIAYLLAKPDDWTINRSDLIKRSPAQKGTIDTVIKELKKYGYLQAMQKRQLESGKWDIIEYLLIESPATQKSDTTNTETNKESF